MITALSLLPSRNFGGINAPAGADKVVHAGMYAGFVMLSAWALWERRPARPRWLAMTAGAAFGYGMLMELAQNAMAMGRACEATDMLANAVGAALGALGWWLWAGVVRK